MESKLYVEKIARSSRRAAFAGFIGILIFISSVVFSFYTLRPLRAEVDGLENRKKELETQTKELETQTKELEQKVKELDQKRETAVAARNYAVNAKADVAPPSDHPVLYLHITNETQRARAQDIANALQNSGYIVPGIQRVSTVLTKTDIRYFHKQDAAKADVIGTDLQRLGIAVVRPRLMPGYETKVPRGQYEIWFANSFE